MRPLATGFRLGAYLALCALEARVRALLGKGESAQLSDMAGRLAASPGRASLMVFAPTIGELNAVRPLIRRYLEAWQGDRLVIFAAQSQYLDPIKAAFPEATVGLPEARDPRSWARFLAAAAPRLVLFAEGPSLHGRFPMRLELPLPVACLRFGVPICVVNARLYEASIPSRIDWLEHVFFGDLLTAAVRHWYAPDSAFRDEIVAAGAPLDRVSAVGDLKYDGAAQASDEPPSAELATIVDGYCRSPGPLLVAGSVNAIDDQMAVVSAWRELRDVQPQARLILAPRYVNNPDVMGRLCGYLDAEGLSYRRRSELSIKASPEEILIVDVFGELRFYYEIADICYVGRNHGLLEPLRFDKPTVAADDWRHDHPSFPLYAQLVEKRAVIQVRDKAELGSVFRRVLDDPDWSAGYLRRARDTIAANKGAAERIMLGLEAILTTKTALPAAATDR